MTRLVTCLIILLPVEFVVAYVGHKPLSIIPSDGLLAVAFFGTSILVLQGVRVSTRSVLPRTLAFLFCSYCLLLASFEFLRSNSLTPLVSMAKLIKPFLLFSILVPYFRMKKEYGIYERTFPIAVTIFIWILFLNSLFLPRFPFCRWGAQFLGFDTYGFPNSFMSLVAMVSPMCLISLSGSARKRWFTWFTYAIAFLLVLMSLSRSSLVVFLMSGMVFAFLRAKEGNKVSLAFQLVAVGALFSLAVIMLAGPFISEITTQMAEMLEVRISKTRGDVSLAGRTDIWKDAVHLILERPIFGYCFQPFSSFGTSHDTAHQQYLEILFKTGGIGLLLYLSVFFSAIRYLKRGLRGEFGAFYAALIAGIVGISIGSFTQPNLTYSMTGNCLFFLLALAVTAPRVEPS